GESGGGSAGGGALPGRFGQTAQNGASLAAQAGAKRGGSGKIPVVVLASSTGGPATLMKFVPYFPKDFPGAVILVQHMPGNFTEQFSKQLAEVSRIKVKEAESGDILAPGQLYVCPGSHHLRISTTGRISLDDGPRIGGYRPRPPPSPGDTAAYTPPPGPRRSPTRTREGRA